MASFDDRGADHTPVEDPRQGAVEQPSAKPPVDLSKLGSSSAKEWKGGGRSGCGPWAWVVIAVVFVALLSVGYVTLKQSVWTGLDTRCDMVAKRVSIDVPAAERQRLEELLQQLPGELRARQDPYPLMGEFSRRATAAMADGWVNRRETGELTRFVEAVLAGDETPIE